LFGGLLGLAALSVTADRISYTSGFGKWGGSAVDPAVIRYEHKIANLMDLPRHWLKYFVHYRYVQPSSALL
jgi:hypothetical protein